MSDIKNTTKDNAQLHDEIENTPSNKSGNRSFASIIKNSLSRRTVLQGGVATAATAFLAPTASASWGDKGRGRGRGRRKLVKFDPVKIEDVVDTTMPTISDDYQYQVLIPWGTPIEPGATAEYSGDPMKRPTSAEAALQTGLGHDGMWFFPISWRNGRYGHRDIESSTKGMLCVNHEFGTNSHALGKDMPESLEDVRLSQNVHGVSVLKIKYNYIRGWKVVKSKNSRRITANTPVNFSGPAAASELLQNPNGNIPLGTVNNCGSGPTPWGTYLTCEENFNGYFGANNEFTPTEEQDRYGLNALGFGYGWHLFDKRFDLSDEDYANEQHRFGWIVEIDPYDATKPPVKRTALGRFKHEAIAIAESSNGRIAAYMGDDQRFDYCYKYVSDQPWEQAIAEGKSPLDEGKLYVARFDEGGTGEWLELTINNPLLAARFDSQAELLIFARLASDILGATPMDRPEWTTIGKNGEVFWTCTNNSNRTETNVANPEAPNSDGHIIRTTDSDGHLGTTFTWDIYLLASSTRGTEGVFTDPDLAYADEDGRLFIGTDGGQPDGLQDQLVVIDTTKENPEPKRLLVGVSSDEITGFTMTPDRRTAFVNIQHPGNGSPSSTNFPADFDGQTIPRDCTLVITRKNGGIIGS
ncbi:PhoX family phosphatase [Aliikangiella marina]|uniref:PhoX family phosphatase n=1 Tax=Aliikangiella marina TaxID=1712262 RepID=A0A545TEE7_9GAMM|nr:PhoX family phosphatase [Aliikangiella marina]TQV75551.1 PhoX family phosphatase [Aliikangiella marina]